MLLLLVGCLFDRETYERRLRELSDADGDGYPFEDDCNDENTEVHPGASERCDEADEDCDGRVDEDAADAPSWFPDADADGFGETSATPVPHSSGLALGPWNSRPLRFDNRLSSA